MAKLRFGIVGSTAHITGNHIKGINESGGEITAFMDLPSQEEKMKKVAEENKVKLTFTDFDELLKCGEVDVISLCTPHPLHCEQAIAALEAGKHCMTEKPMAVRVSECDRMIEADKKSDKTLAVIFQRRFHPATVKAKEIIDSGQLGALIRINAVNTAYKSDFYYNSGGWRGNWKGEGGGVLFNQAPHPIDLLQFLCGMPDTIYAQVDNRIHEGIIDVEDFATAIIGYSSGCTGMVHYNTVTAPGQDFLEIFGEKGCIRLDAAGVKHFRLKEDCSEFAKSYDGANGIYTSPPLLEETMHEFPGGGCSHADCYRELIKKINGEENNYVSPESGSKSLEIANGFLLSSFKGEKISLPINRTEYEDMFNAYLSGTKLNG